MLSIYIMKFKIQIFHSILLFFLVSKFYHGVNQRPYNVLDQDDLHCRVVDSMIHMILQIRLTQHSAGNRQKVEHMLLDDPLSSARRFWRLECFLRAFVNDGRVPVVLV